MAHQIQQNPGFSNTIARKAYIAAILLSIITFQLIVYDTTLADTSETIFSPAYQWHTFHGSGSDEIGSAVAIAADGSMYIVGDGYATWNGPMGQPPLHPHSGSNDILVVKLDNNGRYQWHTFYGSTSDDTAYDVALDADGSLYITGASDATWQGAGNTTPLHAQSGQFDVFVLKLSPTGAYQWHTFYGSADWDEAYGLAVQGDGVYVTGYSFISWNGPAPGNTAPLHAHNDLGDILVLKLNSSGAYQWHTFYGSSEYDDGYAIAVTAGGNVYIAALSDNTWNGDGTALPLHAHSASAPNPDLTILKLNASGGYGWHTFYGSVNTDEVNDIALASDNMIYIVGASDTTWLGAGSAPPIHAHSGMNDLSTLKLDSSGAYQWHTFYGSNQQDYGSGIAVYQNGVYITGDSWASWLGDGNSPSLTPYHGDADISILKLNTGGVYQWHTFYGSNAWDAGMGIRAVYTDTLVVSGGSAFTWEGARYDPPLNPYTASKDLLILRLGIERDIFLPLVRR